MRAGPKKKIAVAVEDHGPLRQSPFENLAIEGATAEPSAQPPIPSPRKAGSRKHRVVLRREKAHRGGKTVIVVSQLPTHLTAAEIERTAAGAKRACGCGGAVKGREIEIQGDQPARIRAFLEGAGYVVGGV